MPGEIKVDLKAMRTFREKVTQRVNFLGSNRMRSVMKRAGDDYIREVERYISTLAPGNVPDLAEKTKKQKVKQVGFMYPILYRTGQFIASFRSMVYSPTKGQPWQIKLTYKGVHDNGIRMSRLAEIHGRGLGRMPKRDFTNIPTARRRRWFQKWMDVLRKELLARKGK